jgi:hypothetical protein
MTQRSHAVSVRVASLSPASLVPQVRVAPAQASKPGLPSLLLPTLLHSFDKGKDTRGFLFCKLKCTRSFLTRLAKFTFRFYRISSKRKQASFCFRQLPQQVKARKGGEIRTYDTATTATQNLSPLARIRRTADAVRHEIARRWGDDEAAKYDPLTNCFTIQTWNQLGFRVKKGEKAIRSITYVEGTDPAETGNEDEDEAEQDVGKYRKTVYLFYRIQVEKR